MGLDGRARLSVGPSPISADNGPTESRALPFETLQTCERRMLAQ